jgi:hypothetical protein
MTSMLFYYRADATDSRPSFKFTVEEEIPTSLGL